MPTLIRDLTRLAGWTPNSGATWRERTDVRSPHHPDDVVLEGVLVDGQRAGWDPAGNERSDLQSGAVFPQGAERWIDWSERFVELPDGLDDRWFYAGPEIHGVTLNQAPLAMGVDAMERRRLEINPGHPGAPYAVQYRGPWGISLGAWTRWALGTVQSRSAAGWVELRRDGLVVARYEGVTNTETAAGYIKLALYRNASRGGRVVYQAAGVRVWDGPPAAANRIEDRLP